MSKCLACGAFSFVDMDGVASITQESASEIPEVVEEQPFAFDPVPSAIIDVPASLETPAAEFDFSFGELPAVEELPPAEEPAALPEVENSYNSVMDEPAYEAAPAVGEGQDLGPAGDPLGLSAFANSEASAGRDGPLVYRLMISGVDTKEIRDSIREVIEDSRFAWDSAEIYSRISKGDLVIDGLNPVKASILVTRIKRLPVKIRWEQYAITEGRS